jgi:hypothetical protein
MTSEHWPELPQLDRRPVDRCDVFPVALGVEAIYLNRRGSMKLMLCAAIGTAHRIDGRSYRPRPSKQHLCAARAIHHFLLRSWHQVGLRPERMALRYARARSMLLAFADVTMACLLDRGFEASDKRDRRQRRENRAVFFVEQKGREGAKESAGNS